MGQPLITAQSARALPSASAFGRNDDAVVDNHLWRLRPISQLSSDQENSPPLRVLTQRPTHLQGASSSGTLITRAHSYVPKLRAPGQPSNEGHVCTALTLSLYSPESHGQRHSWQGTRSPLCPARGADGTIAVGGELCKAASGTEGALGSPAPSEHTQTRRPRRRRAVPQRLGHLGLPVPTLLPSHGGPRNPPRNFASGARHAGQWGPGASIWLKGEARARLPRREPGTSGCSSGLGVEGPRGRTPH